MRQSVITLAVAALATVAVAAQQKTTPPAPQQKAAAAPAAMSLTASTKVYYDAVKGFLTKSAEQMKDTDYGFKPAGVAPEVRSFGAILAHVADANYLFCGTATGTKPPATANDLEHTKKTKAEIQKALADSFTFCDQAWAATNDTNGKTGVTLPEGMGNNTRLGTLAFNTSHDAEHYGNIVTYMRAKGMVPPSSQGGGR